MNPFVDEYESHGVTLTNDAELQDVINGSLPTDTAYSYFVDLLTPRQDLRAGKAESLALASGEKDIPLNVKNPFWWNLGSISAGALLGHAVRNAPIGVKGLADSPIPVLAGGIAGYLANSALRINSIKRIKEKALAAKTLSPVSRIPPFFSPPTLPLATENSAYGRELMNQQLLLGLNRESDYARGRVKATGSVLSGLGFAGGLAAERYTTKNAPSLALYGLLAGMRAGQILNQKYMLDRTKELAANAYA